MAPGSTLSKDMPRYYHKELVSNPVTLSNGYGVHWESIGNDEGVIRIDKDDVATLFQELANARRGGVREINEAEYEDLKKKVVQGSLQKPPRRLGDPWIPEAPRLLVRDDGLPVAVGANPQTSPVVNPLAQATTHIKPPLSIAGIDPKANRPKAVKAAHTPITDLPKSPP
jgi:hypothetical protein